MSENNKKAETLEDRVERLTKIIWSMDQTILLLTEETKKTWKEFDRLNRNNMFLYERLKPVFEKLFPDHPLYIAEIERIIGHEVGPEEPRKPR